MLTGLWHGAAWNFVLWGFTLRCCSSRRMFFGRLFERLPRAVGHIYTLLAVVVGWIFSPRGFRHGVCLARCYVHPHRRRGRRRGACACAALRAKAELLLGAVLCVPVAKSCPCGLRTLGYRLVRDVMTAALFVVRRARGIALLSILLFTLDSDMKLLKVLEKYMLTVFFVAVIFSVPVLTKIEPPKELSVAENRMLASPPLLTAENVLSGKYFRAGRLIFPTTSGSATAGFILTPSLRCLPAAGSSRDVVITPAVLLPYVPADAARRVPRSWLRRWQRDTQSSPAMSSGRAACSLRHRPEQSSMLRAAYPGGLLHWWEALRFAKQSICRRDGRAWRNHLDMRPVFEASSRDGTGAEYYARIDHHYNMRGAYLTYLTLCEMLSSLE